MKEKRGFSIKSLPKWVKLAGLALILIIVVGFSFNIYLDKFITRNIKSAVKEGSKGLYELDFADVDVNLFQRSMIIHSAQLRADSTQFGKLMQSRQAPPFFLEGNFPTLKITGIKLMKLIFSRKLMAGMLYLQSPTIRLNLFKFNDSANSGSLSDDSLMQQHLKEFGINRLVVENATVDYRYREQGKKGSTFYNFKNFNLDISDFLVKDKQSDSTKKISLENLNLSFADYTFRTGDSLYLIGIKDLNYSSKNKTITLSRFYVEPRLSEDGYATKLPYQQERNELSLENIILHGVKIGSLTKDNEISVQEAVVQNGHWNIFLSRIPPLPPARKKVVPSQKLLGISSIVSIAKVKVNKLQLDYREYNTITQQTGELKFSNLTGTVTNVTNNKKSIERNPHLQVNLVSKLMGSGDFKAKFDFLLTDTTGKFTVEAELKNMKGTQLNPAFIPLNKLEIKSGIIDQMRCAGTGDENQIRGMVSMLYHDLHIAVLEKDGDTLKRKGFISLVANILVKNDNPKKDEPVRIANNVVLKRDKKKSFFNLLWMSLFTGIVKIVSGK